jgi:hypothetical protein
MKMTIIGAQRRSGKSNSSGRDYDMAQLFGLSPLQERSSQNSAHHVGGFQSFEYSCNPQVASQIMGNKFPSDYDLIIEPRQGQNGVEMFITGIAQ